MYVTQGRPGTEFPNMKEFVIVLEDHEKPSCNVNVACVLVSASLNPFSSSVSELTNVGRDSRVRYEAAYVFRDVRFVLPLARFLCSRVLTSLYELGVSEQVSEEVLVEKNNK